MNTETGKFETLPPEVWAKQHEEEKTARAEGRTVPRPTLRLGEIVDLKGVRFQVVTLKVGTGRVRLRMMSDKEQGNVGQVKDLRGVISE